MIKAKGALIGALTIATALSLSACGNSSKTATPSMTPSASASMPAETMPGTIVDVASSTDGFSTLTAAITAAGLTETLSGTGPFTVFAPTDAAFAALPAGVLDALLLPANKDLLVKILTYHVISGQVMAADIKDGAVATVEGDTVALSTASGVTVNGAKVTTADVPAGNGVIHVIDTVLLPPGVDVTALATK